MSSIILQCFDMGTLDNSYFKLVIFWHMRMETLSRKSYLVKFFKLKKTSLIIKKNSSMIYLCIILQFTVKVQ